VNPFVQKKLDDIAERLYTLEGILASACEKVDTADKRRQDALQSQLSQRKELVTLQHKASAYDALRSRHDHMTTTHDRLHEGLRQLLALTKALAAELRQ